MYLVNYMMSNVDYISNKELRNEDFDFDMKIILKHEQPITFRPRRLSYSEQRDLRVIIDELLTEGIIRESNSPYTALLLRKAVTTKISKMRF